MFIYGTKSSLGVFISDNPPGVSFSFKTQENGMSKIFLSPSEIQTILSMENECKFYHSLNNTKSYKTMTIKKNTDGSYFLQFSAFSDNVQTYVFAIKISKSDWILLCRFLDAATNFIINAEIYETIGNNKKYKMERKYENNNNR